MKLFLFCYDPMKNLLFQFTVDVDKNRRQQSTFYSNCKKIKTKVVVMKDLEMIWIRRRRINPFIFEEKEFFYGQVIIYNIHIYTSYYNT